MEDYAKGELKFINSHAGQEKLNILSLLKDINGTNTMLQITQDCRDAESLEFQSPLNEAQSEIAKEQRMLIQNLIRKNWTTNQIIYELERVYGMDILMKPKPVIDDRPLFWKVVTPFNLGIAMTLGTFMAFRYRSFRKLLK